MMFSFKENKLRVKTHPKRQHLFIFHTENKGRKTKLEYYNINKEIARKPE